MITKRILMIMVVGMLSAVLAACAATRDDHEVYVDHAGATTHIESDKGQCIRSCNNTNATCMESFSARNNGGVNGPQGMFGASADCRSDLQDCLQRCKGR